MNIEHWPPPVEENPFHIMSQMKNGMLHLVQIRLKEADIDLSMEGFISMIHIRHLDGMHQTQLAETVGRDKPSVTRTLDGLEKRGWVRRNVDPDDRRSHLLGLTDEGKRILELAEPYVREIITQIFEPISDADYQVFLSVLSTLRHQIESLEA